jgi:uncharacterized protein (TIGR03067 family)
MKSLMVISLSIALTFAASPLRAGKGRNEEQATDGISTSEVLRWLLLGIPFLAFRFAWRRATAGETAEPEADHAGHVDQQKLQGTWQVDEFIMYGKPTTAEDRKVTIIFLGDTMKLIDPKGRERFYKFKLDPTSSPKAIDMTLQGSSLPGNSGPAIYEFDGDALKLCLANKSPTDRPKEFKAPAGSPLILMVLKRSKPASTAV